MNIKCLFSESCVHLGKLYITLDILIVKRNKFVHYVNYFKLENDIEIYNQHCFDLTEIRIIILYCITYLLLIMMWLLLWPKHYCIVWNEQPQA